MEVVVRRFGLGTGGGRSDAAGVAKDLGISRSNINRDREIPSRFLQFIIEELAAKIYQQMWYFLL
ncbi:hypothetical protein [Paenibacillus terrae]